MMIFKNQLRNISSTLYSKQNSKIKFSSVELPNPKIDDKNEEKVTYDQRTARYAALGNIFIPLLAAIIIIGVASSFVFYSLRASNKKIEKVGFKPIVSLDSGIIEMIKLFKNIKVNFKNNY
jgi:hypothetical protein